MSGKDDTKPVPDWERLRYPNAKTFDRILKEHDSVVYREDGEDYKPYHALPGWIRLGWPSKELWDRAAQTERIAAATARRIAGHRVLIPEPWPVAKVPWADVLTMYPDREGVPAHEQDALRLTTFWPDCFGQPMLEVVLSVPNITIGRAHYGRGKHRVPASVAAVLRDTDRRAREEVLKAVMPKTHPDREMVISALTGASA